MYKNIKYIIIATIVLLIFVVVITLDATTRYNVANKKTKQKNSESLRELNNQYYNMQKSNQIQNGAKSVQLKDGRKIVFGQAPTNASNTQILDNSNNGINAATQENEPQNIKQMSHERELPPAAKKYITSYDYNLMDTFPEEKQKAAKANLEAIQKLNEKNEITVKTSEDLIITSDNTEIQLNTPQELSSYTYEIEKTFTYQGQMFSIFAYTPKQDNFSDYIPVKYYLFKKVDTTYEKPYYLFDTTEKKGTTTEFTLTAKDGYLYINYAGLNNIKRNVSFAQIMNN